MTKARLALRVVMQLHEDWEDGIHFPPSAWDNLEGYLAEHLDEALELEADNPECHETLAHEIIYEFNLISSYMGAHRVIDITDYAGEE